jgi:hypothetical protein
MHHQPIEYKIDVGWTKTLFDLVNINNAYKHKLNKYMAMCFPKAPHNFVECMSQLSIRRPMIAERISTLIFHEKKNIIGFVQLFWNKTKRACVILNLCRARNYKHLCEIILQNAIAIARDLRPDARRVLFYIKLKKVRLQRLYQAQGWQAINVINGYVEYEWQINSDDLVEFIS